MVENPRLVRIGKGFRDLKSNQDTRLVPDKRTKIKSVLSLGTPGTKGFSKKQKNLSWLQVSYVYATLDAGEPAIASPPPIRNIDKKHHKEKV